MILIAQIDESMVLIMLSKQCANRGRIPGRIPLIETREAPNRLTTIHAAVVRDRDLSCIAFSRERRLTIPSSPMSNNGEAIQVQTMYRRTARLQGVKSR